MKEPGQLAYEATPAVLTWEQQPESAKALWAITEAAIRTDERERCAKVAEESWLTQAIANSVDAEHQISVCRSEIAAAIRAGERP